MNSTLPIRLQRQLPIPAFVESDVLRGLWAMSSLYIGIPLGFVHDIISNMLAADMYIGIMLTIIHYGSGNLCQITVPPGVDNPPTHLIATNGTINGPVVPIHHIVLAANCTRLPYFPITVDPANTTHIPIVMLPVPSPDTFHIFRDYLYFKNMESVRVHVQNTHPGEHEIQSLSRSLDRIGGLYLNACELGFVGANFYQFLNELWVDTVDRLVQYPGYIYA